MCELTLNQVLQMNGWIIRKFFLTTVAKCLLIVGTAESLSVNIIKIQSRLVLHEKCPEVTSVMILLQIKLRGRFFSVLETNLKGV